jgi:hypothetical protein
MKGRMGLSSCAAVEAQDVTNLGNQQCMRLETVSQANDILLLI